MRRSVVRSRAWLSALEPAVTSAMPKRALMRPIWKGEIPEAQRAEVEAGCGGDDDHQRDAGLEEDGVVAEQRVAASVGWRYGRCGGCGHVEG